MDEEQRRALEFISAANRGGYRPTGREVNEWRLRPVPTPAAKGRLLHPEVPGTPERRVRKGGSVFDQWSRGIDWPGIARGLHTLSSYADQIALPLYRNSGLLAAGIGLEYETIPATPGKPAVYGPGKKAEKFLAHLRRLGWVDRDDRQRYAVTSLGHALLRSEVLEERESDEEGGVMVLATNDDLAYGRVLGVIAECGDAYVVDGYLSAEELGHILRGSNACRFLVSTKLGKGRLMELSVMISLAAPTDAGKVRELRRADFHDRYLIGDSKVYGLGSSLNGVGKNLTTLIEMPEKVAVTLRLEAEELWQAAEKVAVSQEHEKAAIEDGVGVTDSVEAVMTGGNSSASPEAEMIDGAWRHGGCSVRHKTQGAAARCRNA